MPPAAQKGSGRSRGRSSRDTGGGSRYMRKDDPKWTTNITFKPPKKIPDAMLQKAKTMFFSLDRDNSGSIDSDELGVMLRSLGQNPSDEELQALIDSVDGADGEAKDGQIQLREFLQLYANATGDNGQMQEAVGKEDVANVFSSFGGKPNDDTSKVSSEIISSSLSDQFHLSVDLKETFGLRDTEFTKDQIAEMLGVKAEATKA